MNVSGLFLEFSRWKLLDEYWPRLRSSVGLLTDEQVWWRPNDASNSVGNLVLHLDGNVRQWLIASFSGADDARNRPAEFAERKHDPFGRASKQIGATRTEANRRAVAVDRGGLADARSTSRATPSAAWRRCTRWSSISACTTARFFTSRSLCADKNLGFYRELDATGRVPETSIIPIRRRRRGSGSRSMKGSASRWYRRITSAITSICLTLNSTRSSISSSRTRSRWVRLPLSRHSNACRRKGSAATTRSTRSVSVLAEDLYSADGRSRRARRTLPTRSIWTRLRNLTARQLASLEPRTWNPEPRTQNPFFFF